MVGADEATRPAVGHVLGKCLLLEQIGAGSSGQIFRARHQTLRIPVAVKVLHPSGGTRVQRRLKQEARLLAKLNHPHVVRIWDFEDDPALPYLVLEYVPGGNLAEHVRQHGPMQASQALEAVAQVADGLAAAREMGIVHRDVKPGNILRSEDGMAKLADLSLAALVDPETCATRSDRRWAGTVAYTAPEQSATAGAVDHRADIYSLGAAFYHLVTGQAPFQGGTSMEVIEKHARHEPIPPHELTRGMNPAVSEAILRMLAKQPRDRYQTYEELKGAFFELEAVLATSQESEAGDQKSED